MNFAGFDGWVPIFRGGRQTDGNGRTWNGDDLIEKALSSFNTSIHEPPIVVGHPRHDAPAFGWIEGLKKEGDLLMAKFRDVVPEFTEAVKKGLYKKRSAAFYPDGRLRHVGFLGGTPPAVKGLPDVAFGEGEAASFEFAESNPWVWNTIARLFRSVREWIIAKEGQEAADRVLSGWDIESIADEAKRAAGEAPALYAEHKNQPEKEVNMKFKEWFKGVMEKIMAEIPDDGPAPAACGVFSEADLDKARKEAAEEAAKKERERLTAEFAERDRQARHDARRAEISTWCERMVKEGRLTPALVRFGVPEMLLSFAEKEDVIEFGETKEKATLYERFKALFEKEFPKLVEFGEIARRDKDVDGGKAGEKLAALTKKKMEAKKDLAYGAAFAEVQSENPELAAEYAAELRP